MAEHDSDRESREGREPGEPGRPAQPGQPAETAQPVEPAQSDRHADPAPPVQPVEPVQPVPPVEPVTAADAAATAGSVDPVGPGASTGAAESSGASAATGPSGSTGPSGPGGHTGHGGDGVALDEEAAWAAIVAGYGQEPPDPPGAKPFKPIEDLLLPEPPNADGTDGAGRGEPNPARTLGGSVSFAPGVASPGTGPRDYAPDEPSDDDFGTDDEGHFVPPEPPPLPDADATAKFAWLGVIGGPVLLLLAVLLGWDMTWWLTTLGIGGFVGGVATLVARMNPGDEDDDDPGRGAVV